jgi:hypothetical protein
MILVLPVFLLFQLGHWLAHLLDELFFRGYRSVEVARPLFVVGVPRSGTTFLHRVLARDDSNFTTLRTWEAFLAPSVLAKRIFLGLGRIDRLFQRPLYRLLRLIERRVMRGMNNIHRLSLSEPEEDFIVLLPALGCLAMIALFPSADELWKLARFDTAVTPAHRARLMAFYRACLQKHLYVFGDGRRLLSKNVSFASWVRSLRETFPDAQFAGCLRDPQSVLPSQLSALEPSMTLFGADARAMQFGNRVVEMLKFYYRHLQEESRDGTDDAWTIIWMDEIKQDLEGTVRRIYAACELAMPSGVGHALTEGARRSRAHRSSHRYSLDAFGWTAADIAQHFQNVFLPDAYAATLSPGESRS